MKFNSNTTDSTLEHQDADALPVVKVEQIPLLVRHLKREAWPEAAVPAGAVLFVHRLLDQPGRSLRARVSARVVPACAPARTRTSQFLEDAYLSIAMPTISTVSAVISAVMSAVCYVPAAVPVGACSRTCADSARTLMTGFANTFRISTAVSAMAPRWAEKADTRGRALSPT